MTGAGRIPRLHLAALALAVAFAWAHSWFLVDWVVDDAAISMAYARNLVAGDGLVAMPGGERIEGYSNPLWVAILAVFELVGIGGMTAVKLVSAGLFAVSAWLAYRLVEAERPGCFEALAAPGFLAVSAQVAIWNASGLENPLFTTLLLAGLRAVQCGALGWAGAAFAGLALTRPEGVAYGAVVAGWMAVLHRQAAWRFLAAWAAPIAAHEAFRWAYFAWPLPNTYYAKLGVPVERLRFGSRGWGQLFDWSRSTGMGPLLAVFAAGVGGRVLAGLVALGVAVGALALPDLGRIAVLLALGLVAPMLLRGAPVLRIAAQLVVVGLAFGVYAGGDWMRGFRWMSLVMGPLAVLFAVGLAVWSDAVARWSGEREITGWVAGVGLLGGLAFVNVPLTQRFAADPVDYPEMIARRLRYTNAVADLRGIDRRFVSTLEMDMGAHMLWSRYALVDLAGLIDIPIARHTFVDREFLRAYVLEERRPDFAHLHRHWANVSGLTRMPEWSRDYVQLPPYDDGGRPHDGVWIRREHVMRAAREPIASAGGLVLDEVTLVYGTTGDRARVNVGVHPSTGKVKHATVAVGGEVLPLDVDWIGRDQWNGETFVWTGLFELSGPEATPPTRGTGGGSVGIRVAVGDVEVLTVPVETVPQVLTADAVIALATGGRCAEAEQRWREVVDLVPSKAQGEAPVHRALADCLAGAADAPGADVVGLLERALRWDRWSPGALERAARIGEARYADGLAAREAGDAPRAYAAFSDVLRVTPHRAWARRYAEEARGR
ncbi:MAG: hypothetical protein R3F61_37890 [Myxococcota bacterium]